MERFGPDFVSDEFKFPISTCNIVIDPCQSMTEANICTAGGLPVGNFRAGRPKVCELDLCVCGNLSLSNS